MAGLLLVISMAFFCSVFFVDISQDGSSILVVSMCMLVFIGCISGVYFLTTGHRALLMISQEMQVIQCVAENHVYMLERLLYLERDGLPVYSILQRLKRDDVLTFYFEYLQALHAEKNIVLEERKKIVLYGSYESFASDQAKMSADVESLPSWKAMSKREKVVQGSHFVSPASEVRNAAHLIRFAEERGG